MDQISEIDIESLKQLSTPRDIVTASLELSRQNSGLVLVLLKDLTNENPDLLIHPAYMQRIHDEPIKEQDLDSKFPEETPNDEIKFEQELLYTGKYRIVDIVKIIPKEGKHINDIIEDRIIEKGFVCEPGYYIGRYVKQIEDIK